jgi:hypothetical protein
VNIKILILFFQIPQTILTFKIGWKIGIWIAGFSPSNTGFQFSTGSNSAEKIRKYGAYQRRVKCFK